MAVSDGRRARRLIYACESRKPVLGIAYAVGMVLIYLLVVAQFRSYLVPLIIMAPIPLTLIGVMPGHALLGAKFTAS